MSKVICRNDVLGYIEQLRGVVSAWENDHSSLLLVNWNGSTSKAMSQEVEEAVIDFSLLFDHCDFDKDCWDLVFRADTFIEAVVAWAEARQSNPRDTDPHGGRFVWRHYQDMMENLDRPVRPRVESIEALQAQKVPAVQQARMYGLFVDEERTIPDTAKLAELSSSKQKYTTFMKTWVHPAEVKESERIAAQWLIRMRTFEERESGEPTALQVAANPDQHKQKKNVPEAPESLEELLLLEPKIPREQVARMKGLTVDEVRAAEIDLGRPLDVGAAADYAASLRNPNLGREMIENPEAVQGRIDQSMEIQSAVVETYAEFETLEGRITAMLDDGVSPGIIARSLKPDFPGLSISNVYHVQKNIDEVRASLATEYVPNAEGQTEGVDQD